MFPFEEMHEYFNDIYAFCDYRNCRWTGPEWASVWNYIYHEYVPPFQSGYEQHTKWHWMTFCAVDGQMPRLPMSPNYYDEKAKPEQKEMLNFIENWIRLYRGEGRKYLVSGKALHPPKVECDMLANHDTFRGTKIDNIKPAVHVAAWEAADGSQALCFGNATGADRKIAYRWNGKWTSMTMKPHELKLVKVAE